MSSSSELFIHMRLELKWGCAQFTAAPKSTITLTARLTMKTQNTGDAERWGKRSEGFNQCWDIEKDWAAGYQYWRCCVKESSILFFRVQYACFDFTRTMSMSVNVHHVNMLDKRGTWLVSQAKILTSRSLEVARLLILSKEADRITYAFDAI